MSRKSYRLTQARIEKDNEEREIQEEFLNEETDKTEEVIEKPIERKSGITRETILEKVKFLSANFNSSYTKHGQMCFNSLPYGTLSKKACIETYEMYRNGQLLQEYKDFLKKVIEEVFK